MTDTPQSPSSAEAPGDEIPRRGFITKFLAGAVGAIAGLVPFVSGTVFFLGPLIRKGSADRGKKDDDGFLKLSVTTDALPDDGTPQSVKVYDDVVDAWNKFLNQEIGSVWLRKMPDDSVLAFSSICPHLGCAVDYRQSDADFYCPCHQSAFALDGKEKNEIPPRPMDKLEIKPNTQNEIWIKYEKFRAADSEKVVVG